MLNIDNKFEIGQEVYVIRKFTMKETCPACKGEGRKIIDGNAFTCNRCYGSGQVNGIENYQVTGKDTIKKMRIYLERSDGGIKSVVKYVFKNGRDYTDKKLFLTAEEADARCKKLNEED